MLKKLICLFFSILFIAITTTITINKPVTAAVTFNSQFPNSHTAQVISGYFGKHPTDVMDATTLNATSLELSDCVLTDVTGIGIFTNLTNINLSNNSLTDLPSSMSSLTKLNTIALNLNRLATVPSCITNFTNLK
ncbi:hypothetical protein AZF37_07700 [endosymbiont 'TC1' of Trimyema compressum]|uniref:leucine-rich repeat domain-containing protein n=1 Tax=endosymbiont 'TC1' of Trimyema compressum TaxID=243899 RepID=UPI0007F0B1DC|nr:leucine-rich repeat domain-containing protein [endosymbiont 'TC1' of Trimyema compressum]AMP21063.1 hypothetical protein AZF37_07700 [endosymbiont 'TC1' of Trimyema compressum]